MTPAVTRAAGWSIIWYRQRSGIPAGPPRADICTRDPRKAARGFWLPENLCRDHLRRVLWN